jgi:hypothetical protein
MCERTAKFYPNYPQKQNNQNSQQSVKTTSKSSKRRQKAKTYEVLHELVRRTSPRTAKTESRFSNVKLSFFPLFCLATHRSEAIIMIHQQCHVQSQPTSKENQIKNKTINTTEIIHHTKPNTPKKGVMELGRTSCRWRG